jgi:hypothetical protein
VLADIDQQVEAGAQHITFGDPDFWNGVPHAMRVVTEMHRRHPRVTYDATIKVEHLLRHSKHVGALAGTGCLLVTTAVESFDDDVLGVLAKGHTAADFSAALTLLRHHGLAVNPTFIPFHPWTTPDRYAAFLERIAGYGLISSVAPIQLALRLLVPAGSLLLDVPAMAGVLRPFDGERLVFPWEHPDPAVDALQAAVLEAVTTGEAQALPRAEIFAGVWELAGLRPGHLGAAPEPSTAAPPHLLEPWFCCAEPPAVRLGGLAPV